MKIQNIFFLGGGVGGSGWGIRVDVIEEFKFLGKFTNKNWGGRGGVGSGTGSGGVGSGGGRVGGGVRVDVNEELKFL